jgi:histone H3
MSAKDTDRAAESKEISLPALEPVQQQVQAKKRKRSSNLLKKKHRSEDSTRPHKFKSGTVALRQIRHLQKSVKHQIPRQALKRLVREIMGQLAPTYRMKHKALDCLHTMSEEYLVSVFRNAQLFAIHSKRQGVREKDYHMALQFRNESELVGAF